MHILRTRLTTECGYIAEIREVKNIHPGEYSPGRKGRVGCLPIRKELKGVVTVLRRTNKVLVIVVTSVLVAAGGMLGTAAAQKAAVPKPQNKLALGENEVKQLLLLMDADKQGKVSKQQFMKFMEAEFERLDKEKKGELDVKELTQPTLSASHLVGK